MPSKRFKVFFFHKLFVSSFSRSKSRDPKLNVYIHDAISPLSIIRKNIRKISVSKTLLVKKKAHFHHGLKHTFKYLSKNKNVK